MNQDELATTIAEKVVKLLSDKIKKLNLFTFPQIIWITELYYLMINSIKDVIILLASDSSELYSFMPNEVEMYNNLVLQYMEHWMPMVIFLAVSMLISSAIICLARFVPYISSYKSIWTYTSYGFDVFIWLLLISTSFYLYTWLKVWFPVVVFFTFVIIIYLEQLVYHIKSKLESKYF